MVIALSTLLNQAASAQDPKRVADIGDELTFESFLEQDALQLEDGRVLFRGNDTAHGRELWVTDGTESGTSIVRDIFPGPQNSNPQFFTEYQGAVVFAAESLEHGRELWITDGTESGTQILVDVEPGNEGSFPRELAATQSQLFFVCTTEAAGRELCVYDGSENTVFDLELGNEPSSPDDLVAVSDDTVCFSAEVGTSGNEPWCSDGTVVGTDIVADLDPSGSSAPQSFVATNNDLVLFVASTPAEGRELVSLDLDDGSIQVHDLNAGNVNSSPAALTAADSGVFLTANVAGEGREPWWFDPATRSTNMFSLTPGSGSSVSQVPRRISTGSRVFFTDSTNDLWVTLGSLPTTSQVFEPGVSFEEFSNFLGQAGSFVYFSSDDGSGDLDLWSFKAETDFPSDSDPNRLTDLGSNPNLRVVGFGSDSVLFTASLPNRSQASLFAVSSGPGGGVAQLSPDVQVTPAGLYTITQVRNGIAFRASTAANGGEPWFKPIAGAPFRLSDLNPGPASSDPVRFATVGNDSILFSTATFGAIPDEPYLWTPNAEGGSGTVVRVDLRANGDSRPYRLVPFEQEVLVTGRDEGDDPATWVVTDDPSATQLPTDSGFDATALMAPGILFETLDELWFTDGTPDGTEPIAVLPDSILSLHATEDQQGALFTFFSGEIWSSDGTPQGTGMTAQFPSLISSSTDPLLLSQRLMVLLSLGGGVYELGVTDGTPTGTAIVSDRFADGAELGFRPRLLGTTPTGWLFVDARSTTGEELWFSDGINPPVVLDVWPGVSSSRPYAVGRIGDLFYFGATTPGHGEELWQTDGTPEGTRLAMELHPGRASEDLESKDRVIAHGSLYFEAAGPGGKGAELWVWTPLLFGDGFESSDVLSWSSAVP